MKGPMEWSTFEDGPEKRLSSDDRSTQGGSEDPDLLSNSSLDGLDDKRDSAAFFSGLLVGVVSMLAIGCIILLIFLLT